MLTLKSPLQLNSIKPLQIHADELGMRIAGNYQLMSISISPQDLLHMTTLQPEVYVGLESENQFITENQVQQKNEWKIDVMNQFLNRILLYQTPYFTYQDEVYISTVLRKLGIENTAEFMEQVKQTNSRSETVINLLQTYYETGRNLKEKIERIYERISIEKQKELEPEEDIRYRTENTLWSAIFERIRTAEFNNTICDYRMAVYQPSIKKEFETSMIQQMRQADEIQLAYIKQHIFQGEEAVPLEQVNYYEQKHMHQTHITEKSVLSQLAAAMLIQLAQEFKYQQYCERTADSFVWNDFTKAFYGSTTEVIERFEEYQSRPEIRAQDISNCFVEWQKLMQEEQEIIQVLEYFDTTAAEETTGEIPGGEAVFTLLENQNMQKQFMETVRILDSFSIQEFVQENQNIDKSYLEALFQTQQRYYEFHEAYGHGKANLYEPVRKENGEEEETTDRAEKRLEERQQLYETYDDKELNYYLLRNTDFSELPRTAAVDEMERMVHLVSKGESPEETHAKKTENHAKTTVTNPQVFLSEEAYFAYLNEVNQRNIEMSRRYYEEGTAEAPKTQHIVLNRESARKSALRALEHPQEVLEEIYETGQAIEPAGSEEIEHYLSLADEQTRAFYYNLLYGKQKQIKQIKQTGQTQEAQKKEVMKPAETVSESAALDQIMVNQWNQYFLIQQMLEKELHALHAYQKKEDAAEPQEHTTEPQSGQMTEQVMIYHNLAKIFDNQLRQQQIFQQFSDEQYDAIFTQQVVKIQELIQQIEQLQQQVKWDGQNQLQQSFTVEMQKLMEMQNEYLEEVNTVQSAVTVQQNSQTELLSKITEMQMQYTTKLLQQMRYNLFAPVIREHHSRRMLETESEENYTERLKEVQTVLAESQKSLWKLYYNKIKMKTTRESVTTEAPMELSAYIQTGQIKTKITREEGYEQFAMIHHQSQTWNEDMVEEIQSSIRNQIHTEQNSTETMEHQQQIEQHMIETRQEIVTKTENNITELIQQNLKTQLNEISNQVYQKLERKLEGERRRRGY